MKQIHTETDSIFFINSLRPQTQTYLTLYIAVIGLFTFSTLWQAFFSPVNEIKFNWSDDSQFTL